MKDRQTDRERERERGEGVRKNEERKRETYVSNRLPQLSNRYVPAVGAVNAYQFSGATRPSPVSY